MPEIDELRMRREAKEPRFTPVLEFDTDDPAFARGWEMGQLYARLEAGPSIWNGTYRSMNVTMIKRVAELFGYSTCFERAEDLAWTFVELRQNT